MNRLTPEEQADQDLAMDWTSETVPSWRNTYDLIRRIRKEDGERWAAAVKATGLMLSPDSDNEAWRPLRDLLRAAGA